MDTVATVSYGSGGAGEDFARSIERTGFAVVASPPIRPGLVDAVYADWTAFFARADKDRFRFRPGDWSGYYPFRSENAKQSPVKDLKEFFHVYAWSELPDGTSGATRELFDTLSNLGAELLGWAEDFLPGETRRALSSQLRDMIRGSARTVFRVLHYPPLEGGEEPGAVRAREHEDINLLTLLPSATAEGLEVRDREGRWRRVECEPSTVVVNAGDMLQEATGGFYVSTTHRVVNPVDDARSRSRYSMPLFLHPRPDVRLSARYTAGEYLDERLGEILGDSTSY